MRACEACGFENAEPGKACPLCGASEVRATPVPGASAAPEPTLRLGEPLPATSAPGGLGRVFKDRYLTEALLGSGGMGQVYRARDRLTGRTLALKVLHPGTQDDADSSARFRREIEVLSRVRHPAVVEILDWGGGGPELFFVTELVDGQDLKQAIQKRGRWPVAEAAAVVATVADALAAAHAQGVVHRDVKPNNVMLAKDGSVRLLDFGLARGVGVELTNLTRTGVVVGTPAYMSPEQFEGRVDERSDVYSLGIVLFELLTAKLPFSGSTPLAVAIGHKTAPPPPPRALRPDVPAWLDRAVLRCLEKEPARRFGTAAALAAELRRPRTGKTRTRVLAGGDAVIEDDSEITDWALVLATMKERTGWTPGMALRFEQRFYRLLEIEPPAKDSPRWIYRFGFWPEGEVFRRLVDYAEDTSARRAAHERSLGARLGRLFRGD